MAEITLQLNTQHFISAFGMGHLVSDFTDDAVEVILTQYQKLQEASENPLTVEWEPLFNDAEEFDVRGLIYTCKRTGGDYSEAFIDLARTLKLETQKNTDELFIDRWLNDEDKLLNNIELLELLESKLMAIPEFVKGAAAIIAKEQNLQKLKNGNYISLGAY
ncbi:MAG: hypothetical protein J6N72_07930 [Psychrobacter sp.]|nr:hypothetical protein [Psychrobacter sp.]